MPWRLLLFLPIGLTVGGPYDLVAVQLLEEAVQQPSCEAEEKDLPSGND